MRRRAVGAAIVCLAAGVALLAAAPSAGAAAFVQGAGGVSFKVASETGGVADLGGALAATVGQLESIDASAGGGYDKLGVTQPDPVSAQPLSDGGDGRDDILVADAANRLVAEFSYVWDSDSKSWLWSPVWSYTSADDSSLSSPVSARSISGNRVGASGHTGDGYVLICDRGADRVFIVDATTNLPVWQYGTAGTAGAGIDQLHSPTSAEWIANGKASPNIADDGDVAICDAGNHRVIVVRAGDYVKSATDAGFSANSITWQYGASGYGSGTDQLESPTSVQQLSPSKNMLICDKAAARAIEVRYGDYDAALPQDGFTSGSIVWQFSRSGAYALSSPTSALSSLGGAVWIADTGHVYGVATVRRVRRCSPTTSPACRGRRPRRRSRSRRRRRCRRCR